MLNLYYKDLYSFGKNMVYYSDAALNAESVTDQYYMFQTAQMWKNKYEQLLSMKWYQKLFYKRES
jgi:hypothetical protein